MPGRGSWGALGFVSAVALCACESSTEAPCTTCPVVAGTYVVTYDDLSGSSTPGCATLGLGDPPAALTLTQQQSVLAGTLGGVPMAGSLYVSDDLTLTGGALDGGFNQLFTIHGVFLAANAGDGGTPLTGTVTETASAPSGPTRTEAQCALSRNFTAR